MSSLSTESTPRERLERAISVLSRVRMYWRSTAALLAVGLAISLALALSTKRVWRSETSILYRDTIQTSRDPQSTAARAARIGPKLKDTLYARGTLAGVIEAFGLYPEKTARSMVEAIEEMQLHVGFRAQSSDTYVLSFTHDDPQVAQQVAARFASLLVGEFRRDSLDSATMTRDFLRRELAEASAKVDEASRALATFLAKNPQFQWGLNDSPYAPQPLPAAPGVVAPAARPGATPVRAVDPELARIERQLARVEVQLAPARPRGAPSPAQPLPTSLVEAQRARDAAAAAVAAADLALAEKLQSVTALHPDAVAAKSRADGARRQLATAEGALRILRAGGGGDAGGGDDGAAPRELTPARRASLEGERSALLRQIAARRARLEGGVVEGDVIGRGGAAGAAGALTLGEGAQRRGSSKRDARDAGEASADGGEARVIELETEWHRLRLALDRAREYLKSVQTNERAADLSADAAENKSDTEMVVLDPAYLPSRPDRGRGRIFFPGAALTLFFALGVAGVRVLLNDTLYDDGDIHALGGPVMLAAMPAIPATPPRPERAIVPAYAFHPDVAAIFTPPPSASPPSASPPPSLSESPLASTSRAGEAAPPAVGGDDDDDDDGDLFPAPRADDRAAALARVGPGAIARGAADFDGGPEVEILGADIDPDGLGVYELLRGAPALALASLRVLRHRLDRRRGDDPLVVAVLSPGPAEGKTALAVRLAMTLAEAERARVILVEGNLERPRVAAALGLRLPPYAGLSDQIRRRMLGEVRPLGVVEIAPSLAVLAEPSLEAAYPAALHSTQFHAALRALRRYYDYVVIDGPAVLGSGDANVIEDISDGVLLVARASVTRASSLSRAAEQLGDRRLLGVVLNDVTGRHAEPRNLGVSRRRNDRPEAAGRSG